MFVYVSDMLTDDAKQNMIAELLNELKCARVQMTTILEQNDKIKQQMMQIIKENGKGLTPLQIF